jgi:Rieske Fe-S protein
MTVIGLLLAIPGIGYFIGPLRRRTGDAAAFVDVGAIADLPLREWRLLALEMVHEDGWNKTRMRHAIWVFRRGPRDGEVIVFSSICPHLGCPVNWQPDQSRFYCPCHGGIFNTEGEHTGGPPPRSLDPLEYEVRAGRLWVRWQDFKIGVSDRIPTNA